jgi:L-ribulose-5-phosphate 3-epimerase
MKNIIGVIQGRLLPKYKGRYQAHPKDYWQKEFYLASNLGLDCIEFILDFEDAEHNPLLRKEGVREILTISKETGVLVKTICADYFMEAPLHSEEESIANNSMEVLSRLLAASKSLGVNDIVIPCVDQSSLNGDRATELFIERIKKITTRAKEHGVNLSLETDLNPKSFADLLKKLDSDVITVNYDIGNSASLGYDPIEELNAYGDKITDIHIKDRVRGGGPVILGEGDTDFKLFFSKLKEFNYDGPFIMQAYRDDEGLQIFIKQFEWIKKYLNIFD